MGKKRLTTKLIHCGLDTKKNSGSLSEPIYKSSTLIFDNYKSYLLAKRNKFSKPYYGRLGTNNQKNLEKIMAELYESEACVVTSSGLSAIAYSLTAFLDSGSECVITENCYEPVYNFTNNELKKFGIKTYYYKTNNMVDLSNKISQKTKLIYMESPGSINFQVEDIEKIVKIAKKRKIITIFDNTWATFLGFNPIKLGVDVVIESATKYISGHSDNFCGIIACNKKNFSKIKSVVTRYGDYVHPESCAMTIRGLRTLENRLNKHRENAQEIFNFLKNENIVKEIIFLPDKKNKSHELWKKYFSMSNGLITFSIEKKKKIESFLDQLKIFKIGFSWGGFESLILPINKLKTVNNYSQKSVFWFRIHVGLESATDLINDLKKGFDKYDKN